MAFQWLVAPTLPVWSAPTHCPRAVLGHGKPVDCARSRGKPVDCASRTGWQETCLPAHGLPTGPQGAPALRACPQASHTLGLRLETASRSPHGPLTKAISISSATIKSPAKLRRRRLLRSGSVPTHRCSINYPSWWSREIGGGTQRGLLAETFALCTVSLGTGP